MYEIKKGYVNYLHTHSPKKCLSCDFFRRLNKVKLVEVITQDRSIANNKH